MSTFKCNFGPEDETLWLTRPLGYWEKGVTVSPGDSKVSRDTVNNIWHIIVKEKASINVDDFREAVRATIYNQPNLRADVDLTSNPVSWKPATDFTSVFTFEDLRSNTPNITLEDISPREEEETNAHWRIGSGKPLFRCLLLRIYDGYIVMLLYHHVAGDGSSGMFIMGEIMKQYELLRQGKPVNLSPQTPQESVEEFTRLSGEEAMIRRMIEDKKERINTRPHLPFSKEEMNVNNRLPLPLNKSMFREGDPEKYPLIRQKCRDEGVTMGVLMATAGYLALGAIHARSTCEDISLYQGMKNEYIEMPINMRRRANKPIAENYVGVFITKLNPKMDIDLETSLWPLAKKVKLEILTLMEQKQHLLYSQMKEDWETRDDTAALASSLAPEDGLDLYLSDNHAYMFDMEFPWGFLDSMHTSGSYWSPRVARNLFFMQTTKKINYDMVYSPGKENSIVARQLLDLIFYIMENVSDPKFTCSVKDLSQLPQIFG